MAPARTRRAAPTIPDVAARAGVSRATAARALSGQGSVSAKAAEKVLAAARDLGYQANSVARSMITGRTMTLGVVVGDIENEFFSRLVRGFTDTVRADGFDTILANTDESVVSERAAVRVLLERRVDGLMVAPASMYDAQHLREARAAGARIVLVDRRVPRIGLDTVIIDGVAAAREAVGHLVSAGHRRIGLLTGSGVGEDAGADEGAASTTVDRWTGYREGLEAAGLTYDPTLVLPGDFHLDAARRRTTELLRRPGRPTAVLATDSIFALAALLAIRDVGLSCPDDVSLVGFDDPDWAPVVRPPLSVMDQPAYELGATAGRRLVARVGDGTARPRTISLAAAWRQRGSIAPPSTVDGSR